MVLFNYTTRELTAKIVYYGPGLCGKTTNLQFIYDGLPNQVKKGKMLSLATKTDRTLFFDFLPIELGRIRGMRTRVQLYTVPGQVFYNSTRKLVLKGADGVVFVADSQQKMMESNVESYRNLEENLGEIGLKLDQIPLVMQFNKRDLPNLSSVEEMNTLINRHNAPFYEAVATTGIGVEDTLKAITKLVLNHLAAKYQLGTAEEGKQDRPAAASAGIASLRDAVEPARPSAPVRAPIPEPAPAASANYAEDSSLLDDVDFGTTPSIESAAPTAAPATDDDLEVFDLDGEEEAPSLEALPIPAHSESSPEMSEDLSDLLEEIPEDSEESPMEVLREIPSARPMPVARTLEPPSTEPARPAPRSAGIALAGAQSASRVSSEISADPLGILSARKEEPASAPAIHVGDVVPGKQHQITVPLEMSVDGRKVRLQLRMTLTLST